LSLQPAPDPTKPKPAKHRYRRQHLHRLNADMTRLEFARAIERVSFTDGEIGLLGLDSGVAEYLVGLLRRR
jgi:hypothetical protein